MKTMQMLCLVAAAASFFASLLLFGMGFPMLAAGAFAVITLLFLCAAASFSERFDAASDARPSTHAVDTAQIIRDAYSKIQGEETIQDLQSSWERAKISLGSDVKDHAADALGYLLAGRGMQNVARAGVDYRGAQQAKTCSRCHGLGYEASPNADPYVWHSTEELDR